MIKVGKNIIFANPKVKPEAWVVTRSPVTRNDTKRNAARQKAWRDRQKMGGLTWEQFHAETVNADG